MNSPYYSNRQVGDLVRGGDGYLWRVHCVSDDGSVLGLEPIGWRKLYWWWQETRVRVACRFNRLWWGEDGY